MLHWWHLAQVIAHHLSDDGVAVLIQVNVAEGPVLQIPAAWLSFRTLIPHGKEFGKSGYEALALALAPFLPDLYLARVDFVVDKLGRPRVHHYADGNVPLGQVSPDEIHLACLFGDPARNSQRSKTQFERFIFHHLAISPS